MGKAKSNMVNILMQKSDQSSVVSAAILVA